MCTTCMCTSAWLTSLRFSSYTPPYNSEKPAINLIHPRSSLPPAQVIVRARARAKIIIAINYRRKLRWFCTTSRNANLVSTHAESLPIARDLFKPKNQPEQRCDAGRFKGFTATWRTLWKRVDYTRLHSTLNISRSALEILDVSSTDTSCDHVRFANIYFIPKSLILVHCDYNIITTLI